MSQLKIDVHQHFLPPVLIDSYKQAGLLVPGGAPVPPWSAQAALEMMGRQDITASVLSISSPGIFFGDIEATRALARGCNEFAADLLRDHPQRFGAFAVLPLPDVRAALTELEYALNTLHLDGVTLLASPGGIYLGDSQFEELFQELNRRQVVVFMHPAIPPTPPIASLSYPPPMLEYVFDTTRAIVNLIYSGTLERYPFVKIIAPHAGGTAPFIAYRITESTFLLPDKGAQAPQGGIAYLRQLYYDIALSPTATSLASLTALVDTARILFGTDFPYTPPAMLTEEVRAIATYADFDEATRVAIHAENALRLFPRLAAQYVQ